MNAGSMAGESCYIRVPVSLHSHAGSSFGISQRHFRNRYAMHLTGVRELPLAPMGFDCEPIDGYCR